MEGAPDRMARRPRCLIVLYGLLYPKATVVVWRDYADAAESLEKRPDSAITPAIARS